MLLNFLVKRFGYLTVIHACGSCISGELTADLYFFNYFI